MKAAATSLFLACSLLLAGCGQGIEGARDVNEAGTGGSTSSMGGSNALSGGTSSAGQPTGTAGSSTAGTSPQAGTSSGGTGSQGKPCGPAWMAGTAYATGDIVLFEGSYYIAEFENPGYDPSVSTYFWEPYTCSSDGGGGNMGGSGSMGGSGPVGDSAFDDIVTEQLFNQMFPDRNGFYTYQHLVEATGKYPAFAGTGSTDQRKREAAAFLANVARETGELVFIEQIQKDDYCQSSNGCPCEGGKQYYGRGPIRISWNYNYCAAGSALGYDLRGKPELVAQDATIAWATGLWFWMTQSGAGNSTPHDGIQQGFGETIRSINGGQECNGAWPEAVNARVSFYQKFCQLLGVSPGDNVPC